MGYWYKINIIDFWSLDPSIVLTFNCKKTGGVMIIETNTEIDSYLEQYNLIESVVNICNVSGSGYSTIDPDFLPTYHSECDDVIIKYYETIT